MKRLLITGATGFVGRAVMRALAGRHLGNLENTGKVANPENLKDLKNSENTENLENMENMEIETRCVVRRGSAVPSANEIVETDDLFAESADWWAEHCQGIDTVLHIAWYAEPGKYLSSDYNLDCLAGTLELAKGAVAAGVRRFVGIGTCFEYEFSEGPLHTDGPLDPQTPYAAAKVSTYLCLKSYFAKHGLSFLWARLFYLYGEGEDSRRFVPYLHDSLSQGIAVDLTDGTQVRDFIEINAAAALLLGDAFSDVDDAVNIASGEGISVRALAERIADGYGRRDLLNFGARPCNLTDPPVIIGSRKNGK